MYSESAEVRQVQDLEWESLVSKGLELRERQDSNQWSLGELASEVESVYGEDSVGKFASEISVVKKSVLNYRTVYKRYQGTGLREKYPKLSFSHFKSVVGTEDPEFWLKQSDLNDWSVEKLGHEMGNSDPRPKEEKPEVVRCPECGMWKIKDIPKSALCSGHYVYSGGKLRYT